MDSCRSIENLIYRYAELIDAGNLDALAALFEHASVGAAGDAQPAVGSAAVRQMYEHSTRLYPCGTPRTRHMTTNVQIEVNEQDDYAHSRSCFNVLQQTDELPLQMIISGRYEDEFEKVDGEWRFCKRRMHIDLMGDLSHHLLFDASSL